MFVEKYEEALHRTEFDQLFCAIRICYDLEGSDKFLRHEHLIRQTKKHKIDRDVRNLIASDLSAVLTHYADIISRLKPETDEERFLSMCESNDVSSSAWDILTEAGAFLLERQRRKFVVSGTKSPEEFLARMMLVYGFTNPEQYFVYQQGIRPVAQEDCVHVNSGSPLAAV